MTKIETQRISKLFREMTKIETQRISKLFRRKAKTIEKRFQAFHGQSSIEHLADVIERKNKIVPGCYCYACSMASFIQPKPRRLEQHTRNEN